MDRGITQAETERDRRRQRETDADRQGDTDTQPRTEKQMEADRDIQRQTHPDRDRQRQTEADRGSRDTDGRQRQTAGKADRHTHTQTFDMKAGRQPEGRETEERERTGDKDKLRQQMILRKTELHNTDRDSQRPKLQSPSYLLTGGQAGRHADRQTGTQVQDTQPLSAAACRPAPRKCQFCWQRCRCSRCRSATFGDPIAAAQRPSVGAKHHTACRAERAPHKGSNCPRFEPTYIHEGTNAPRRQDSDASTMRDAAAGACPAPSESVSVLVSVSPSLSLSLPMSLLTQSLSWFLPACPPSCLPAYL